MTKVTYKQLEDGDPLNTIVGGVKFKAHEPVDVADSVTMNVLERVVTKNDEGLLRSTTVEKKTRLVDVLKTNPYFTIEGEDAPKKKAGRPPLPKIPEDYRAHAQAWIANAKSCSELEQRWDDETPLRERLGIPDDGEDVKFIQTFFHNRFHELKQAVA